MEVEYPEHFLQDDITQARSGCYVSKPNITNTSYKPLIVPLRHIDYHIEIVNSLVHIKIQQTYFNPIDKFLAVDFSMPIDPNSCIYKIYATFNDVKIQGVIKQKQQAKRQFQAAKKEGRQALLASLQQNSRDIFNFDIGNIPPNTQFLIRIQLVQQLSLSMNTFYKLLIPSTIQPRFINKIQNVRKNPQYLQNKGKSIGKSDYKWSFKINLQTTNKIVFFQSPSHKLECISKNEKQTEFTFVLANSEFPNKDFSFLYTTENFHLPSYVLGTTDQNSTVLLSFIPKFCELALNDAFKAQQQNKKLEVNYQSVKGQFVFLLDRSGSMGGSRINRAKQALILFIKSLPEDSYFNIISFGTDNKKMFRKSERYSHEKVQQSIKLIDKMMADMGGTQIYKPLKQVLNCNKKDGYPKHIFVLTDGQITDTQGVISMVKKNVKYCRVHTIGIGNGASLSLIKGCAQNGKGKYIMISDQQNSSEKIIELLESALSPVISKIDLQFDQKQIESIVPNPKSIPYILKDQIVNFYVTYKKPLTQNFNYTFKYEDSVTKLPYQQTISINPNGKSMQFVDKMSHFKVLRQLQNLAQNGKQIEDNIYYVKVKDYKKQAINYSVKHQILSKYTSFICINKKLVDGQFQQFQNKGTDHIYVQQFTEQEKRNNSQNFINRQRLSLLKQQDYNQYFSQLKRQQDYHTLNSMNYQQSTRGRGRGGIGSNRARRYYCQYAAEQPDQFQSDLVNQHQQRDNIAQNLNYSQNHQYQQEQEEQNQMLQQKQSPKKRVSFNKEICQKSRSRQKKSNHKNHRDDRQSNQQKKRKKLVNSNNSQKQKQKQKVKEQKSHKVSIKEIIKLQNTNGSWNQCSLINQLSKNYQQIYELLKIFNYSIVVTKLVILWLQKYYNTKQYSLILKKAKQWLQKALVQGGFNKQKLQGIQIM